MARGVASTDSFIIGAGSGRFEGMRIKWQPLAAGLVVGAAGYGLFHVGSASLLADGFARAPSFREAVLVLAGSVLLIVGAITALTPNVLLLLRLIYGPNFGRGATCPVMVVCPSCGEYNARGRAACKPCGASLEGARAVGGDTEQTA